MVENKLPKNVIVTALTTYLSHSATAATHISLETNCLLHPNVLAFSGNLYSLVLILKPFPHDTEHGLHSVYSVTAHSAKTKRFNFLTIYLIWLPLEVSSEFSLTSI